MASLLVVQDGHYQGLCGLTLPVASTTVGTATTGKVPDIFCRVRLAFS